MVGWVIKTDLVGSNAKLNTRTKTKTWEELLSVEGLEDRWMESCECWYGRQAELVGHCMGHWAAEGSYACGLRCVYGMRSVFFWCAERMDAEWWPGKNWLIRKNKMHLKCSASWTQCNWLPVAHQGDVPGAGIGREWVSIRQMYPFLTTIPVNAQIIGQDYCSNLLTSPPATPLAPL